MRRVFVSHAHADAAAVSRLVRALEAARDDVVVHASSDREAGAGWTRWAPWIRRTLAASDLVVFVGSVGSLASSWCSAELGIAWSRRIPVIAVSVGDGLHVHPLVDDVNVVPLDDRFLARLPEILRERFGTDTGGTLPPGVSPYPGLAPLTAAHAAVLFGRAPDVEAIVRRLDRGAAATGAVVVSGPSGSGKSSLVLAGVLPRLQAAGWHVVGPLQPMALASQDHDAATPPSVPTPVPDAGTVVVLDQAEELATLPADRRAAVVAWTEEVLAAGCWLLVVVRTAYRDTLPAWTPVADHHVGFLGPAELEQVVRGPARVAALDVDEALVDRLVRETARGDALPLLAFTLEKLWQRRVVEDGSLQESTLDELGGVRGVLRTQAGEALATASAGDTDRAQRILAMLTRLASATQVPPTRTPRRLATLTDEERAWSRTFVEAGLLAYRTSHAVGDQIAPGVVPTGEVLVDVTHEALFEWDPLAAAIRERREHNVELERLERDARAWEAGGRSDDSLLATGDRLRLALRRGPTTRDPLLAAYLRASRRNDRERRLVRALTAATAVLAVVAAVAAVQFLRQRDRADDQRVLAESARLDAEQARAEAETARTVAQSVRVAAQATAALDEQHDLALLAAVAARAVDDNTDTEGALRDVLAAASGPLRWFQADGPDWSTLRLLTPDVAAVVGAQLDAAAVDLRTREVTPRPVAAAAVPGGGRFEVEALEPTADGRTVLVHGRPVGGDDPPPAAVGWVDVRADDDAVLVPHAGPVEVVAGTTDLLVLGDSSGTVAVVDRGAITDAAVVVDAHATRVTGLAVTSDARWLASSSADGVRVLERREGGWTLVGESAPREDDGRMSEQLAFVVTDGRVELFGAGSDPTVRHWSIDGAGLTERRPLGEHGGVVLDLAVDPAAPLLLSVGRDGALRRWATDRLASVGVPLRQHDGPVAAVSTTGSGRVVTGARPVGPAGGPVAVLWDLRDARTVERDGVVPSEWSTLTFATVVAGEGPVAAVTTDGEVLVADGRRMRAPRPPRHATWVADGSLVIETSTTSQIDQPPHTLWTVTDDGFEELWPAADAVAVGRCLAAVADDARVVLVDVGGCGDPPAPIELDADGVVELALSPDEQRLAVVRRDAGGELVELRTLADGALVGRRSLSGVTVTSATVLDSSRVALGRDLGGTNVIVDLAVGTERDQVVFGRAHGDAVWFLVPDVARGRLHAAGQDGLLTTSLTDGTPVGGPLVGARSGRLNDPAAEVRGLTAVADGEVLLAVHGDRLVAWELAPERLAVRACRDADRRLDAAEVQLLDATADSCR